MKNRVPLVSVIIPVYNSIYIREALNSVSEQTYTNIETIVIDDGSTDNSLQILSDFKNIRMVRTENKGVSAARNEGLRFCRGELITFLDSDDIWIGDKIEKQVDFLSENRDIEIIFGRFENFFQEGRVPPQGIDRSRFLNQTIGKMKHLGTMMTRKEVFSKVGDFDQTLRTGEDLDWFIRIKDSGIKDFYEDRVVLKRRLHDTNLSYKSLADKKNLLNLFKASIDRKRGG